MTYNQFQYWQLQENQRHNLAMERENERSHRASENISMLELSETVRHQKATEANDATRNAETATHNRATEIQQVSDLNESIRHNVTSEQQNQFKNYTERTAANARAASESQNAQTNAYNAETRRKEWWTNSVLGAVNSATNVVSSVVGSAGRLIGLFG